jgi:GAF domain-containing protein
MQDKLPHLIAKVFETSESLEATFSALMPALGEFLKCERCFLYLRDPQTRVGRVPFCWTCSTAIPQVYDENWKIEPESLVIEDPMFAAALRTEPTIFVEDINNANPAVLSRQFEEKSFGHRALVHAHLCQQNQLWGILQPCTFDSLRRWTLAERDAIHQITEMITPIAARYVEIAKKIQPNLFISETITKGSIS